MSESEYKPIGLVLVVWIVWCLLGAVAVAAAARGAATVAGGSVQLWSRLGFLGIATVSVTWALLHHRSLHYVLGPRHISRASGVLWRQRRSIPLEKITDIDVRQGPLERLFHYGQVWVFTHSTGTELPEEKLIGLRHPDAVKQRIIAHIEDIEQQRQQGMRPVDADILHVLEEIRDALHRLEKSALPDDGAIAAGPSATDRRTDSGRADATALESGT